MSPTGEAAAQSGHSGRSEEPPGGSEEPRQFRHISRYALILLALAILLGVWGVVSRVSSRNRLGQETATQAIPVVIVQKPSRSPPSEQLVLPGSVQAFYEAPIYARTSGYLRMWYTDIGERVKRGQLLAEIDTPEIDQQYRQAKADLATALANANLARITDVRWKGLLANQAVSQQDADTRAGQAQAAEATAASAQANVARLRELESFKRVVAPFDGVVTARNTDIGALINAGESTGNALFRVADTHRLRVYVDVPQPYARQMRPGIDAQLLFNEHPGKHYAAELVRTAEALDPSLRTLRVELQVDNAAGELFPGSYAEVHFEIPGNGNTWRIPATALIFRSEGLQVGFVGPDGHAKLKSIVEGRDFGTAVEVLSGLSAQDEVIINPPDSLSDGGAIRIAPPRGSAAGK